MVTCLYGLPLLADTGYGLAVLTTFTRGRRYLGNVFYDVAKNAVCRLVSALAEEAKDSDLAIVGVSPGWMAVERMTGLSERQQAEMESVAYIGRAVTELRSSGVAALRRDACRGRSREDLRVHRHRRATADSLCDRAIANARWRFLASAVVEV
jgi:NAD(P)-dependent dehydrogenase (short-subunit alcohol dehydrogenase family)